jgi:hypothetical protein
MCQPKPSSCRIPQLDDVKALNDDAMGLQGPTSWSWWEGKTPWVQACQSASGGTSSLFSGASLRYPSAPGWGFNIHLVGFYPYGGPS